MRLLRILPLLALLPALAVPSLNAAAPTPVDGLGPAFTSTVQPPDPMDAAELALALRKLTVVGNVLYVAAHPDDENTALLSWLVREKGLRTGYLSMTRGDGGQNLIGSEKGELIGLIRTQELLAARRVDRAEQLFSRAIDFGYSKGPDETLRIWGREQALADVVFLIRRFRPDVVITRFPTTGDGGHGHHTSSAILAGEAFEAAGDPKRFPEQLSIVSTWKPRRLFWNAWRRDEKAPPKPRLSVDLGTYNPLLGRAYTEIAAKSRSMHKSQGFGSAERRGSILNDLELVAGEAAATDPFEGIDLSWGRVSGGRKVGDLLAKASRAYDARDPSAVLPLLLEAQREMGRLPDDAHTIAKKRELLDAIRSASGLWLEAVAAKDSATPGGTVKVSTMALNRSRQPMTLRGIEVTHASGPVQRVTETLVPFAPPQRKVEGPQTYPDPLPPNQPLRSEVVVAIPKEEPVSSPYWLAEPHGGGLFTVGDQRLVGLPESAPALTARFQLEAGGVPLTFSLPVVFRDTDPVRGELYLPFDVEPAVTLNLDEKLYLYASPSAVRPVRVTVRGHEDGLSGTVRLRLPAGFEARPAEASFTLGKSDDEAALLFTVTPPGEPATGTLRAEAELADGRRVSRSLVTVDYPHIPRQRLYPPAEARLVRLDLSRAKSELGYVMGSGDEVPAVLRQLGYRVTLLGDEELDTLDLSRFEAIVVGVRAYNTRPRLKPLQKKLLAYVEAGGTLVSQYSTSSDLVTDELGPFPLKLSRDRVTVEEAAVTRLLPDHPALNAPNRIADADFEGWLQERGLYFAGTWDPRYQAPLSMNDPGEKEKSGGLLVARHGKGTYVFTGLAFFRQLPAGVPGAVRLFTNLIEAR